MQRKRKLPSREREPPVMLRANCFQCSLSESRTSRFMSSVRKNVIVSESFGVTKEYPSVLSLFPLAVLLSCPFQLRDKGLLHYRLHPPRRDRLLGRPIKHCGYVLRGTSSALLGSFRSVRYFVNVERARGPLQPYRCNFVAI